MTIKYTFPQRLYQIRSDQSLIRVWLFATPWISARQASLSITNSRSSLRLTSIELVMPSSHLIRCHPLLLLPPIPPSSRVFSNESTLCMRWPKYWSFSFSIIPSKEHPGLVSFRMDWLDLLTVQGTLIYFFAQIVDVLATVRSFIGSRAPLTHTHTRPCVLLSTWSSPRRGPPASPDPPAGRASDLLP